VALGRGHDVDFWTRFVEALRAVDPNMAVNIEHEDTSLGRIEGLQVAADVFKRAAGAVTA
jgi:sugar phosphate isomerase/epimerase